MNEVVFSSNLSPIPIYFESLDLFYLRGTSRVLKSGLPDLNTKHSTLNAKILWSQQCFYKLKGLIKTNLSADFKESIYIFASFT